MTLDDLTYKIRGAIFEVYKTLGPGLLESVYEAALMYELINLDLIVHQQVALPVVYKKIELELGFRIDILVENSVIIEIKSVVELNDAHKKQLLNYLKLSNKRVGFLVNFNASYLVDKESLIRIVNNYS
jgi:GxxExxY protein